MIKKGIKKKMGFIHYFFNNSSAGVNTVVLNNLKGLEELAPELDFVFIGESFNKGIFGEYEKRNIPLFSSTSTAELVKELSEATSDLDLVMVENPLRGINPYATSAFKTLVESSRSLFHYRNHDYIADYPQDWDLFQKVVGHASKAFPTTGNFSCSVLTSSARSKVQRDFSNEITVLKNSVVCDNFYERDEEKCSNLRKSLEKKGIVRKGEKIIACPNRVVDRKNIEESLLITKLLNESDNYRLIVTASIDGEKPYHQQNVYQRILESLVDKYNIPCSLGKASEVLDGEGFSVGDLYHLSCLALTTSLREGFGYIFVEPWVCGIPLIGRYIVEVIPDFMRNGLNLDHLYEDDILGNGKDYIQRMVNLERILSDKGRFDAVKQRVGLNKQIEKAKFVVEQNRDAVKRNYNHLTIARQLLDVFDYR